MNTEKNEIYTSTILETDFYRKKLAARIILWNREYAFISNIFGYSRSNAESEFARYFRNNLDLFPDIERLHHSWNFPLRRFYDDNLLLMYSLCKRNWFDTLQ